MTSPSRGSPMPIRSLTGEFFVNYLAHGLNVTLFGHIIPKAVWDSLGISLFGALIRKKYKNFKSNLRQ
jgi:hypothetical protein